MGRNALSGLMVVGALWGCGQTPAPTPPLPAEVTVSRLTTELVTDALEYTGTTAPLEAVDIRARVTGFLEEVCFRPRAIVNKGDVLFLIDQRPFKNALDSAIAVEAALQAQLRKAQSDLDKVERLVPQGVASQDELTAAVAARDALAGQIAQAQAQIQTARLNFDFCRVTAPIHGRVSRNLMDPGNIVAADNTVLTTIVNDDAVYAYFNFSERDALVLRAEIHRRLEAAGKSPRELLDLAEARPAAFLGLMTEDDFPHAGHIDYVAPNVDPGTGTVEARARFENTAGMLLPGLFVRLRIPVTEPYQALTVTERALGSDQGQRYLLVVNEQNIVEYRPVKIGTLHGGSRVILGGVSPDDRVIISGLQRVRPGVTVHPVPAFTTTAPAAGRDAPPTPARAAASSTPSNPH